MAKLPKFENLLVERRGPRLYVTLNRPEARNALSREMVAELLAVAGCVPRSEGHCHACGRKPEQGHRRQQHVAKECSHADRSLWKPD